MTIMSPLNAALFFDADEPAFLAGALSRALSLAAAYVVTDDPGLLPDIQPSRRLAFSDAALDQAPINVEAVLAQLRRRPKGALGLIVDMGWAIANSQGVTSLERWGAVAEQLAETAGTPVVSLYNHDLVIEEQVEVAFRTHRQFVAPSGRYDNPYWIPSAMRLAAPLDEQLSYMLGRVVPDYQGLAQRRKSGQMFARGATPSWLAKPHATLATASGATRWHIHCLGHLRVFIGGRPIDWRIDGGATNKIRTLFSYLLQRGEKGAHANQIGELLWPGDGSEAVKRGRLHHTIAMLRKTLHAPDAVLRSGDTYSLHPPRGSWIDIETFEQLCRRGAALLKAGDTTAALQLYSAADQLYNGDLFEDLPQDSVEAGQDDWCMPRRIWLREMAQKLHYDFASVLLRAGRSREALEHCLKALAGDPASEAANGLVMRIFVEQGRFDAMHRQYRQYRQAVAAIGAAESAEFLRLYRELSAAPKKNQSRAP
jgi:DNA-binding SARP family transcriptional activator